MWPLLFMKKPLPLPIGRPLASKVCIRTTAGLTFFTSLTVSSAALAGAGVSSKQIRKAVKIARAKRLVKAIRVFEGIFDI